MATNEWSGWLTPPQRLFSEAEVVQLTDDVGRRRGVYWNKVGRYWYSTIQLKDRKKKYLGAFRSPDEAAAAFECAVREREAAKLCR